MNLIIEQMSILIPCTANYIINNRRSMQCNTPPIYKSKIQVYELANFTLAKIRPIQRYGVQVVKGRQGGL